MPDGVPVKSMTYPRTQPLLIKPRIAYTESKIAKLSDLGERKKQNKNCRDSDWITDRTRDKVKKYSCCADTLPIVPLLKVIDKNCGRN